MKTRRFLVLLLCVILSLGLLPLAVGAETIDTGRDCALTVDFLDNGVPIAGFPFAIYCVASVDAQGTFTAEGDFQKYPVRLNGLSQDQYADLARTLDAYARQDDLKPLKSSQTLNTGSVYFEDLQTGLYLVAGNSAAIDGKSYTADSFLVSLPSKASDGSLTYKVITRPKHITSEIPDTPETVSRRVLKLWQGDVEEFRPEKLTVHLLKDGAVYDTVALTEDNSWRCTWENLPKYHTDGHLIRWQLTEEVPEHYLVSLGQEGETFLLTNTYNPESDVVTRRVQKRWDDIGYTRKRPASVTVELLNNGLVYDTRNLTAANKWQYTWENLPARDKNGKENVWTLREIEPTGYTSTVKTEGDTFIVLNSYKGTKLPQTGQLWWPVPLLCAAGLTLLAAGLVLKKRRGDA